MKKRACETEFGNYRSVVATLPNEARRPYADCTKRC